MAYRNMKKWTEQMKLKEGSAVDEMNSHFDDVEKRFGGVDVLIQDLYDL